MVLYSYFSAWGGPVTEEEYQKFCQSRFYYLKKDENEFKKLEIVADVNYCEMKKEY